jgi:transketolase
MMEGISDEAASLAGHLGLSKLCWIYDNNHITIEGNTALAFSEDVGTIFSGYGWNVTRVSDANDLGSLSKAFQVFRDETERPTLVIVDSHIGYGAPDIVDTSAAHGEPLGAAEVKKAKHSYGWPEDAKFLIPDGVYKHFAEGIGARGSKLRDAWMSLFSDYEHKHPELAAELLAMQRRELPEGWDADIPTFDADPTGVATRDSSGEVLNAIAPRVPWLIGGSADLAPSTKTRLTFAGAGDFEEGNVGARNFHFGIREHAAAAITSGLALSKVRAYWSSFLVFSDYARGAIRLSALMEIPVIHVFTHDSIGMGQDGPTHQPVEQLVSLRAIPGLVVLRPADANEAAEAWRVIMALQHDPVALVLTRQAVPTLDRSRYAPASGLAQGAYVLADPAEGPPEVIIIATGSEVSLAVAAYAELSTEGVAVRVVSMPSCSCSTANPPPTATRCCLLRSGPGSRSRRHPPWGGTAMWAPTVRSSACTRSGPPLRSRISRPSSASPPTRWPTPPATRSNDTASLKHRTSSNHRGDTHDHRDPPGSRPRSEHLVRRHPPIASHLR